MKLLQSIFFVLLANLAVGQNSRLAKYQIDSLAHIIDTTKVWRTISDGTITDGGNQSKGKRKPQSEYSETYYLNPAVIQLWKVEHGESLITDNFDTYYFYNNNLILVRTTMHKIKNRKEVLNGHYYFNNGELFYKEEAGKPLSTPEAFLQRAEFYLMDAKVRYNYYYKK
jgi:hypothetical protein